MASTIVLQSNDGENFTVDIKTAMKSNTIKDMIEGLGHEEGDNEPIPLPKVNATILKKVLDWAEHHKDDPTPQEENANEKKIDEIPAWDAEFLKIEQVELFDLILAANYLDVKGLMDSSCKIVADMIKGKTPDEIRQTFNIKNDFSDAEKEMIRKENQWAEEN